jgi:diguanylate cyclase (GGDEF)-like protein
VCELAGTRLQHYLVIGAVKISAPGIRVWPAELNRDALLAVFVEIDVAVLITAAVGLSPRLVAIALPTVLLAHRFLVHPVLVAQTRVDGKSGLLNISAWKTEAEAQLRRAVRSSQPLALILLDIDHFKLVNDNYGHLAGDRVLQAIAETLTRQSRDSDRAARFGGEEYVLLLAQTGGHDAGMSQPCRFRRTTGQQRPRSTSRSHPASPPGRTALSASWTTCWPPPTLPCTPPSRRAATG